jgi:phage-related protein
MKPAEWKKDFADFLDLLKGGFLDTYNFVNDTCLMIEDSFDKLLSFIVGSAQKAGRWYIFDFIIPVAQSIGSFFAPAIKSIGTTLSDLFPIFKQTGSNFVTGVASPISDSITEFLKPAFDVFSSLMDGMNSAFNSLDNVINGALDAIGSAFTKNIFNPFQAWIDKTKKESSPFANWLNDIINLIDSAKEVLKLFGLLKPSEEDEAKKQKNIYDKAIKFMRDKKAGLIPDEPVLAPASVAPPKSTLKEKFSSLSKNLSNETTKVTPAASMYSAEDLKKIGEMGMSGNVTTIQNTITVTVPSGSTTEQTAYIEKTMKRVAESVFQSHMRVAISTH